jgi:hypothetical protein
MALRFSHVENQYGNYSVEKARVILNPSETLNKLKFLTVKPLEGNVNHAQIELKLRNNFNDDVKFVTLEKNEIPRVTLTGGGGFLDRHPETKSFVVDVGEGMTFQRFVGNARRHKKEVYGKYRLDCNNCQDFVLTHLDSNGILLTDEQRGLVNQRAGDYVPDAGKPVLNAFVDTFATIQNFRDKYTQNPSRGNEIKRSDYASFVGKSYGSGEEM